MFLVAAFHKLQAVEEAIMLRMRIIAGFEVAEILMLTAGVLLVAAIVFAIWPLPARRSARGPHQQLSSDKHPNARPTFLPDHGAQRHRNVSAGSHDHFGRPSAMLVSHGWAKPTATFPLPELQCTVSSRENPRGADDERTQNSVHALQHIIHYSRMVVRPEILSVAERDYS
jgi:hypothetical protein